MHLNSGTVLWPEWSVRGKWLPSSDCCGEPAEVTSSWISRRCTRSWRFQKQYKTDTLHFTLVLSNHCIYLTDTLFVGGDDTVDSLSYLVLGQDDWM